MKTSVKYEIKKIKWQAKTFIGKRSVEKFNDLASFFTEQYRAIDQVFQNQNLHPSGPPCAIYYGINEDKKETDLAAVFPMENLKVDLKGFQRIELPPSDVLTTTYVGPFERIADAYQEMENYLKDNKYKKAMVVEEYLTDPLLEKDSSKWTTNIYFVLV